MMIESTCNVSNVHGLVNNNSNPYKTMVMDTIRMN